MNLDEFIKALRDIDDDRRPEFAVAGTCGVRLFVCDLMPLRGQHFEHPVRIEYVIFERFVDFSEWRCDASLRIENCIFLDGLKLADTAVKGVCSLKGTHLHTKHGWFDLRRMKVDGLFDASRVEADACLDLANFCGGNDVWFHSIELHTALKPKRNNRAGIRATREWKAVIDEWSDPQDKSNTKYLHGKALHLTGAVIAQNIFFQDESGRPPVIIGQIDLRAKVGRQVNFRNAVIISTLHDFAVDLEKSVIGGSVFFIDTRIKGQIDLRAKVGGQVNFNNTVVKVACDRVAVNMEMADVAGSVLFGKKTALTGRIDLRARVGRNVEFTGTTVSVARGRLAVSLVAADVSGSVSFEKGTRVVGGVSLRARVGGQITFDDATVLTSKRNKALDLEAAAVHGSVVVKYTTVVGRIDLRAQVGRNVTLSHSVITSDRNRIALDMDAAAVGGSLFVTATTVAGGIDLRATVGGDIEFSRSQVTARHLAVNMNAANVAGSVLFDELTVVLGKIDLRAQVGRNVTFSGATLRTAADRTALNMDAASVGGSVFFQNGTEVTGAIDLRTRVGGVIEFTLTKVVTGRSLLAVDLSTASVGGSVFIVATTVVGMIDLRAHVEGQVSFNNATVTSSKIAVYMEAADVGGELFFLGGTRIRGSLWLYQAKLRGGLSTTRSPLHPPTTAPDDECPAPLTLGGSLFLDFVDMFGPIYLHHANIYGDVSARHLTVHGDFHLCGSVVGMGTLPKGVFGVPADATCTWLPGGYDRQADPIAVQTPAGPPPFERPVRYALNLELAEVHGQAWLLGTRILGNVTFEDADIHGEMNFGNGEVHGDLKMRSAEVNGRVFVDEQQQGSSYPKVKGVIDLSFARLQQVDVRCQSQADPFTPSIINLTGASVDSFSLSCELNEGHKPALVMEGLTLKSIEVHRLPPHPAVGAADDRLHLFVSRNDVARFVIWFVGCAIALFLASRSPGFLLLLIPYVALSLFSWGHRLKRPKRAILDHLELTYPFNRGYYLQVEQLLRSAGDEETADEVFHMRRCRENERPRKLPIGIDWQLKPENVEDRTLHPNGVWQRFHALVNTLTFGRWRPPTTVLFWPWVNKFFMGYGVRTSRLVHIYILLWLFNTAVFLNPRSVERPIAFVQMRMTDEQLEKNEQYKQTGKNPWPSDGYEPEKKKDQTPKEWNLSNAFFMAMRVQIPILQLVAENDWSPATRNIIEWERMNDEGEKYIVNTLYYADYASVMMVLNTILIPLIIAGLTGYIKKRQSMA